MSWRDGPSWPVCQHINAPWVCRPFSAVPAFRVRAGVCLCAYVRLRISLLPSRSFWFFFVGCWFTSSSKEDEKKATGNTVERKKDGSNFHGQPKDVNLSFRYTRWSSSGFRSKECGLKVISVPRASLFGGLERQISAVAPRGCGEDERTRNRKLEITRKWVLPSYV